MKAILLTVLIMLFTISALPQQRPYIVVKESDYEMLRERADRLPWSAMKANANKVIDAFEFQPGKYFNRYCNDMLELAGALALIAVLEPGRKPEVAEWMKGDVLTMMRIVRDAKENSTIPGEHGYNVGPSQAAFITYILLDVMYNDIATDLRDELEDHCDFMAGNHSYNWEASKFGGEGMMALYHHGPGSEEFIEKADAYRDYILSDTSLDGVYNTGPGYGYSRLYMDGRIHKKMFMDVCEYNGYNQFYDNPRFVNVYEWALGYSVTPFNRSFTFGDSPPTKTYESWDAAGLRANRFSHNAQAYASWFIGEFDAENVDGNIIHYVFTDSLPVAPKRPVSRVFTNGGAWLLENSESSEALAGALWSIDTENESHSHYEANAIHIAGYGEHILRNSGYDGWGNPDKETWQWIRRTAEASNTVLIGHENHTTFRGSGITASILHEPVEYAAANSAEAIPNGEHTRHLYFVHPFKKVPGYFIILDEVRPSSGDDPVSVVLHPSSAQEPVVLAENEQYRFAVKKDYNPDKEVFVDIYQVTQPETVEVRTGYMASYEESSRFYGKYLYSTYPGLEDEWTRVATVLYPFTADMEATQFERESTPEYDAVGIKLRDDIHDFLVVPATMDEIQYHDVTIQGKTAYWRRHVAGHRVLSLTEGTKLLLDNEYGMTADDPISFVMTGESGTLISPGTDITIKLPGLKSAAVNGAPAPDADYEKSEVTFYLEKGTHKLTFITGP